MEELLVLSDVHGNLEALRAVVADAGEERFMRSRKLFLGDYVDFGPWPDECISYIRSLPAAMCIMGNHDRYVGDETDRLASEYFKREDLVLHTAWTRGRLSPQNFSWLRNLPERCETSLAGLRVTALHADTESIEKGFVPEHAAALDADVILCGHVHCAYEKLSCGKMIVNPGSVGESLDGDNRAAYAVLSVRDGRLHTEIRRVDYSLDNVETEMIRKDMPLREEFISTMRAGSFRM